MKNKHQLITSLLVLFAACAIFASLILILLAPFDKTSTAETVFKVEKGEGAQEIGRNLVQTRLIRSDSVFFLYVLLTGKSSRLQAGEYVLSGTYSVPKIAEKMAKGEVIKRTITIVEGWNLKDISRYLKEKGMANAEELLSSQYQKLEGYLFPDTYEIPRGASLKDLISAMQENFERKAGTPSREAVILASLLEKEVRMFEDKRIVSGILWKRLRIGMPLQVDATITYLTGKETVSNGDTKIDSPYNTYRYKGLPAGPIANPGLESIQAALEPQETPYLYYLSTPEGKTIFSKTLQEHNAAKTQYLQ